MEKVVICIPIYRSNLERHEVVSLRRCYKILGNYRTILVAPKGLDVSNYCEIHPKLTVEFFSEKYFKSTKTYNKLLLSRCFYRRYLEYEFMLVYQLDAYVFRDELLKWCDKNYDYIGAPTHNYIVDNFTEKINCGTLNGGLSLRKVKSQITVLSSFKMIHSFNDLYISNIDSYGRIEGSLKTIYFYLFGNNTWEPLNKFDRNEDLFFAVKSNDLFGEFKTAPVNVSCQFSFDNSPEKTFILNNRQLPFGCHAIDKNVYFWKDIIDEFKNVE